MGRPVDKLAYAEPGTVDLGVLAATYTYGLASNHPFNDGNKRTAWSSCVLFLKVNGTGPVGLRPRRHRAGCPAGDRAG